MGWHVCFTVVLNGFFYVVEGFINGATDEFDSLVKVEPASGDEEAVAKANHMEVVYGATFLLNKPDIANSTWRNITASAMAMA